MNKFAKGGIFTSKQELPVDPEEFIVPHEIRIEGIEDIVRVVRCKDCKYYTFDGYHKHNYCSNSRGMRYIVLQEYFCSYGERRNNK